MVEIKVLEECGRDHALLGLSLSYHQDIRDIILKKMEGVALKLSSMDGGHNKFLESIVVWLDIRAPRYWWQQFDTYRVGVTKQSESTMNTLMSRNLTFYDFNDIPLATLEAINHYVNRGDFELAKSVLPEGFMQRRIVCTNYKALRHIIHQRKNHRLKEWHVFCEKVLAQLEYPEYIGDLQIQN